MSVIVTLSLCLTTSSMMTTILRNLLALLVLVALVNAQYRRQPAYQPQQDAQYQQDVQYQQDYQQQPRQQAYAPQPAYHQAQAAAPLPAILSHKQGLTSDGAFNYNFAADNGLQQGESISPDGSRTGSYSYVDPNGKTISVKYSAGKDGFRILEGDHLPKAPAPQAPAAPQQQYPSQYQGSSQYQNPAAYSSGGSQYQSPAGYSSGGSQYQSPAGYSSGGSQYQSAAPVRYTSGFGGSRGGSASTQALFRPHQTTSGAQYRVQEQSDDQGSQSYDDGSEQPAQYSQGVRQQQDERQQPHNFGSGYSFEFAG